MNITLCGSIAFYPQMLETKSGLEALGHVVDLPPSEVPDENGQMIPVAEYYAQRKAAAADDEYIWELKAKAIHWHFEKVAWADAILVTNVPKNGIDGYVGANTLMEMGVAFYLGKKIFLLNAIPEMSCTEEIRGMMPTVIGGALEKIS